MAPVQLQTLSLSLSSLQDCAVTIDFAPSPSKLDVAARNSL